MALCPTYKYNKGCNDKILCVCHGDRQSGNCSTYHFGYKTIDGLSSQVDPDCQTVTVRCVGYSDENTTTDLYNCPGHRNYHTNNDIIFDNSIESNKVIYAESIDAIQTAIRNEINARKEHLLYISSLNDYSDPNVAKEDIVKDIQPNNIGNAIKQLRNIINNNDDYKYTSEVTYVNVYQKYPINSSSITPLKTDINKAWTDCICYSDCLGYCLWTRKVCTCNINCMCDYGLQD